MWRRNGGAPQHALGLFGSMAMTAIDPISDWQPSFRFIALSWTSRISFEDEMQY